ncbi:hypothetical protein ACR42D_10700 [Desulfovibrio caledoniensis]
MPSLESIQERNVQYSTSSYIWLLEVLLPSGEDIRIARNTEDIEWPTGSGVWWHGLEFEFDDIEETNKHENRKFTFRLSNSNATGALVSHVEELDAWRKEHGHEPCDARLIGVNSNLLHQTEPEVEYWFEDAGISIPPPMRWVLFKAGAQDIFKATFPRRKIYRDFCTWIPYRDSNGLGDYYECPYVSQCNHTLTACRETWGNTINFGGYAMVERGATLVA